MAFGTCYICQQTSHAVESHHVLPQTTGGESGPVIPLCAVCHNLVHAQALNILSKQENKSLFPESQTERAFKVVGFIVRAIRKEKESPDFNNPYPLQIRTTKGVVALLHILKGDAGYTNLQTYVEDLLKAHIKARFGSLRTNQERTRPKTPVKSEPSTLI